MEISEFFESIYRVRKLRGKSEHTIRLYRFSIRNMGRVLGKVPVLGDFTDDNIALVMQSMLDRGCSPYTANKERSQLLALWRFACKLGKLSVWPTISAESEPERVPQAWLVDDVQSLLAHVNGLPGFIGDVPAAVWWRAILHVCLDTGERIGAVVKSEWKWLDRDWLLVPAEARKGRKRDRRYLLSRETVDTLRELRRYAISSRMFEWPYCDTYLWTKYTAILKRAGLPHGPKDKFHRLRKTVGSVAYAAGLDAQDVLDHESKRTTKKYLDPRFSRQTQASQVLADWLRNPPAPPPDLQRRHG